MQIMEIQKDESRHLTEKTYHSFVRIALLTANLCLGSFYFGYMLAYFGTFTYTNLEQIFHITIQTNLAQGLLQGCIPVGAGLGALGSYWLLGKFSRRNCVLCVNALALIMNIVILYPNMTVLFLCRVVQGMCVGLYSSIIPLLIKQFAPVVLSGTLGAFNQMFIAFGVFFAFLFQLILVQISPEQQHWRLVFGFPLITITLQTLLLLLVYKYETPPYLLGVGREAELIEVLEFMYRGQYVDKVLTELKNNSTSRESETTTSTTQTINSSSQTRLYFALHFAVLQQMTGVNVVVVYGSEVVAEFRPDLKHMLPVLINLEPLVMAVMTSYLLSKLGRKIIIQVGTGVLAVMLVFIGVGIQTKDTSGGQVLVMVGMFVFMAAFGLSLGPIMWLYIAEIVQPRILPFTTLTNWVTSALVMTLFPIIGSALGSKGPLFLFYAVWAFASLMINQKYMVETKGKSQTEIYREFEWYGQEKKEVVIQ